ncbi:MULTISPECIES: MarR family winged helix-turn-helix transcriptional regulator [Paenibacillus]|uniref:Transcriptional regulator n=2 Tax=Paenibacillus TaxID=44249 RepID=A0ABX2Z7J0_PAEPO|nr:MULTISPECIES: MarR family transcriptional regulator [Paenibacillus]MDR6776363.1 DNA-binding MarR family transcriptional regulator [Paenibacillus peoriae]ODA05694.1 transcriptional regulator [Paenibacillus polymyxa]ODB65196.1 transcriptional regulator [Paenibacillus polymyxa]OME72889.1 MarR family transcriptional regulator [Paenibacillus peoriae]
MQTNEFAKIWSRMAKDYKVHMEQQLAPSLTEAQLTVLEVLNEYGRMKPSQLIPYLATTPAAVTMLLDRMERNRLVTRFRDVKDRRIVWIVISDQGREEVERGLRIRDDFLGSALNRISQHNQNLLVYLLGKITTKAKTSVMTSEAEGVKEPIERAE